MTIALLFSLGTWIVQIQSVWVNFACTKVFSISWQKRLSMSAMWVCVAGAQYSFRRSNNFIFLVAWSRGLQLWREPKISSRCYWICLLSWQVMFRQREMRISWWLCNNSEIHLRLWKVWSLVVCSQRSFYVTGARKDDKNRQNTFFLCQKKMNLVPNKQLLLNVRFQPTKYGKKELCVYNKLRETIGDVYCQTYRNEKCVYISTNETTSFYDCKSGKPAATFWIFPWRTQNRHICCFFCDGTNCFARKTSRDYEKEKPSPFLKNFFRQSQPSTSEPEPKKFKMSPNMEKTYPFPIGWWVERNIHFSNQFIQFQSTVNRSNLTSQLKQNHDLLSLQRRNPVDSRFWSRLCYNCSERSRPKFNNQLTRNTLSCLAIAVVSKAKFLG